MNECGRRAKRNCLVALGVLWGALSGGLAIGQTVETPTITSDSNLIPPGGLAVTLKCTTPDAAIHYTMDGTDPTVDDPSVLTNETVTVSELTNLTSNQPIEFRAKAFLDPLTPSAVATATFTSFADPEFHTQFTVVGVDDTFVGSPTTLTFGFKTGAADGLDALDTSSDPTPPAFPGVPPPPISVALFTTDLNIPGGGNFLATDYRTRQDREEFRLQVQLYLGGEVGDPPPSITISWAGAAGADSDLSQVPYLHLVRKMNPDNLEEYTDVADLLQPGSVTVSAATFADLGTEDDANNRIFYVVYRNENQLQVNIGPQGIPDTAKWRYRPFVDGSIFSDWFDAGAKSPAMHPGDYEINFATPVAGYFRPPNQIVTLEPGETPTVLDIDYLAQETQATMAVEPLYDPDEKTVDITCTFTYTPDVSLTQVVWTFNLTTGWTIGSITGLPAGWTADIQGDGITVVFSYAAGRGTPSDSYFDFVAQATYGGDTPGDVDVAVDGIASTPSGGGSLATTPPPTQTSSPRFATLDVDGVNGADQNDALFVYRKIVVYDFKESIVPGSGTLADIVPDNSLLPDNGQGAVTAQTVLDTINELGAELDVDGANGVDQNDALFIYRKIVVYNFKESIVPGSGSLSDIVPDDGLLPDGVTAEQVKANIEAIEP